MYTCGQCCGPLSSLMIVFPLSLIFCVIARSERGGDPENTPPRQFHVTSHTQKRKHKHRFLFFFLLFKPYDLLKPSSSFHGFNTLSFNLIYPFHWSLFIPSSAGQSVRLQSFPFVYLSGFRSVCLSVFPYVRTFVSERLKLSHPFVMKVGQHNNWHWFWCRY